jgi:hypothetical protein
MIHTICSCSYCCCGCNCGKFFGKLLVSDCWSGAACDCPQSTGVGWDWFDLAGLHNNDGCWGCHCFLTVSMMLMICFSKPSMLSRLKYSWGTASFGTLQALVATIKSFEASTFNNIISHEYNGEVKLLQAQYKLLSIELQPLHHKNR